jgi:hypothetical protein
MDAEPEIVKVWIVAEEQRNFAPTWHFHTYYRTEEAAQAKARQLGGGYQVRAAFRRKVESADAIWIGWDNA